MMGRIASTAVGITLLIVMLVACGVKAPPTWVPADRPVPTVAGLRAEKVAGQWRLAWSLSPVAGASAVEIFCDLPASSGNGCAGCPVAWIRMGSVAVDANRTDYTFGVSSTGPVRTCKVVPVLGGDRVPAGAATVSLDSP